MDRGAENRLTKHARETQRCLGKIMASKPLGEQIKAARRNILTWPKWLVPEYVKREKWYSGGTRNG